MKEHIDAAESHPARKFPELHDTVAEGGGPLLDMGPYYVTALVTLLGPVVSVVGAGNASRSTRTIGSGPRAGEEIPVHIPLAAEPGVPRTGV